MTGVCQPLALFEWHIALLISSLSFCAIHPFLNDYCGYLLPASVLLKTNLEDEQRVHWPQKMFIYNKGASLYRNYRITILTEITMTVEITTGSCCAT
jgi:hypothetical protein